MVKLLPFMEQDPLYQQLNFQDIGTRSQAKWTGRHGGEPKFETRQVVINQGKYFYSNVVPSFLCPSADVLPQGLHGSVYPNTNQGQNCYYPSMGAQLMGGRGWCNQYDGNMFKTGPTRHGNRALPDEISSVFGRFAWAARFRDVTDGESQVIAWGEVLPYKSSYAQNRGWARHDSGFFGTTGPLNFPVIGRGEPNFPGPAGCHHYGSHSTSAGFKSRHKGGAQFVLVDGSVQFLSENIDYVTYNRLGDRRDGKPLGEEWKNN